MGEGFISIELRFLIADRRLLMPASNDLWVSDDLRVSDDFRMTTFLPE